jgi:hypothetical protein
MKSPKHDNRNYHKFDFFPSTRRRAAAQACAALGLQILVELGVGKSAKDPVLLFSI